jgi:predicted nucleotidyltransferase
VIKSIDREKIDSAVRLYSRQIYAAHPEIIRIIWFGSWIHGHPAPGSDVDLCIIVKSSTFKIYERPPQYLPVGFPTGMDIHVYTTNEFQQLDRTHPSWKNEILKGIDL